MYNRKRGSSRWKRKYNFIEPVFEAKYWGGQALKERYGYTPDLPNIAIAYHVIALPQHHLDNTVRETGEKLSEFYKNHSELFGCNREDSQYVWDREIK